MGMLFSSFFHLMAERLPKNETLLGRSYCLDCKEKLRLIDVFPLIGYLINKGKCHYCKSKISFYYPLVEVLGGAIFVVAYLLIGFKIELLIAYVFISVLMIESISDAIYQIVIDKIWIIGLIPLVVIRIIEKQYFQYLLSSAIMFSLLFIIAVLGKLAFKKDALGGGDIKLYIFIGFCLTWPQGLLSLFIASFVGVIYGLLQKRKSETTITLVPFIFLGVLLSYFWGNDILNWYLNLLGM